MEWIGVAVLATVSAALAMMLIWVSWTHRQRTGLWWSAAGITITFDGLITLAGQPAFLLPFATDLVGPGAAWLFYRGGCDFADRKPHPAAAVIAVSATLAWLAVHAYVGPTIATFYISASAELPLVAMASLLVFSQARTTMSRFLAASTLGPIGLVLFNPTLKEAGISSAVSGEIWLAAVAPLCIFATCVFLERGLAEKNRALEQRGKELDRYQHHLEEIIDERTAALDATRSHLRRNENLASIGTLTAGLAHQVNNPIGSIMAVAAFARLCRGDDDELETLRRAAGDIEREAGRCGEIVRDMLRFASDRPTEKKLVAIDALLERVVFSLQRQAKEYESQISMELDDSSPLVLVSPIEVEQALTNVIENAIQSREKGARVEVSRVRAGGDVRVVVCDDGCGIERDDLEHVFDPFFTSRLESGGTGLGLSVAHGIAQEHDGHLKIESEPGRGTRVEIWLPVAE